jgi:hypothetical protein
MTGSRKFCSGVDERNALSGRKAIQAICRRDNREFGKAWCYFSSIPEIYPIDIVDNPPDKS